MEAGSRGDSLGVQSREAPQVHSDSMSQPTTAPAPPPTSSQQAPARGAPPASDPSAGPAPLQPMLSSRHRPSKPGDDPLARAAKKVGGFGRLLFTF